MSVESSKRATKTIGAPFLMKGLQRELKLKGDMTETTKGHLSGRGASSPYPQKCPQSAQWGFSNLHLCKLEKPHVRLSSLTQDRIHWKMPKHQVGPSLCSAFPIQKYLLPMPL